jgi:hypothetical protein
VDKDGCIEKLADLLVFRNREIGLYPQRLCNHMDEKNPRFSGSPKEQSFWV